MSPRDPHARTWGLTARGRAERAVPGQQAGQQRAEPSHVAARGQERAGARVPGLPDRRAAGSLRLLPARSRPSRQGARTGGSSCSRSTRPRCPKPPGLGETG